MARQNNTLPKGAMPHLRPPHAPRDPSAGEHDYGYPQPHDQQGHDPQGYEPQLGDQRHPSGPPRDIFNTLRPPEPASLASRLEPLSSAGRGYGQQDGYGRSGYEQQHPGQGGHPSQGGYGQHYDPYARPAPAPAPGGYHHDADAGHDPRYYGDPASDPRYQHGQQGYAPQYDHEQSYAYDDPYRPHEADPYGASGEAPADQHGEGEYYGDDYADEPEPRRGPRAIVVVSALIGAIVLGGGLAYGYKSLTNGGREGGKLPILRADGAPVKAQPTEPGGKQVAHTDKKFLNRLTDDSGAPRTGPGPVPVSILPPTPEREPSVAEGGPRRVPTMVVGRDGSIAPSGSGADHAPPPRVTGVPGMVVDGLSPRHPAPPLREAPAPARSIAAAAEEAPPQAAPRRVAVAPPVVASEAPSAAVAPAPPRAAAEPKRPLPRQAARTEAPAATSASTGAGYVAVLSSRQSHMDALKSFADIQQKYASVLQGRTPDVRQANLGEKGIWYRVVVGPPGSRDAANKVCGQLKSQGYSGCWTMPY